ncbi:hypothetical protein E4M02_00365 [Brevundimonas sp. S30B]|uniref:hypothetical protein n=1 Tax=unclassified Brevundimonas TaxID=2622653 RepID=UPI0010717C98|nr:MULTISPECIES: hypothetical protein [unclassified Brevundimonas]QBX37622.1 hypothetical protein E4M01_07455 [Brevundimonas sp. MF30-B]TFW03585.1 hypothetical protein E4M02_00365 [Brevundimonas sp. S30B]
MALEAMQVAKAVENAERTSERRGFMRRKLKDRRGGGRINKQAPRRSLMKVVGAFLTMGATSVFALALVGTQLLMDEPPVGALTLLGTLAVLSAFTLMLGSIEQRLIEIRLELMMHNGGMRQADRRQPADRRDGDRRSGERSGSAADRRQPTEPAA